MVQLANCLFQQNRYKFLIFRNLLSFRMIQLLGTQTSLYRLERLPFLRLLLKNIRWQLQNK